MRSARRPRSCGRPLERLRACGAEPSHGLLLIAVDCAARLGDAKAEEQYLAQMSNLDSQGLDAALTSVYVARREKRLGNPVLAIDSLEKAAQGFRDAGWEREWAIARGELADILSARGQLDEALRIRTEEELPVYERLGDVRSKAVTQGKIADILFARGQLDEALALHEANAKAYEALGDGDGIANVRFRTAQIRLSRGDHQTQGLQQIHDDLAESFAILTRMGRADGIGHVGLLLAQVLAAGGHPDRAGEVLDQAEAAFVTLGQEAGAKQVRTLREQVVTAGGDAKA